MESPNVFPKWALPLPLNRSHVVKAVLDAGKDKWKRTSTMRQHDVQFWKFVQRTRDNELRGSRRMLKRKAEPVCEARRAGESFAVNVRIAIERVKQKRISEFLTPRKKRLKGRLKQIITLLDGIRQMDCPHAWFAGDAVQLLQSHYRILNRNLDAGDKAVGISRVRFNRGVIDDSREPFALFRCGPLPWHGAG